MEKDFLKRVRAIAIQTRRLIDQGMIGQYLSAFRGSGMQFREFRNYVYGDDVRHISWNVSARTTDPVLKTFEEERERTLFLIVDVSASLRKGPWARAKAERLAEIAAVLCMSAAEVGDQYGLMMYSDHVEKVVPPQKGKSHLLRVIRDVLYYEPRGSGTDPDVALLDLEKILKKKAIVFLLSDLEKIPSPAVLKRVASKHEFSCFAVENPNETHFADWPFIEIETAESGRPVTIDAKDRGFVKYMDGFYKSKHEMGAAAFRKAQADLMWLSTETDFIQDLKAFFKRKAVR
jgi:uncharacterized protein (DUF58 family)